MLGGHHHCSNQTFHSQLLIKCQKKKRVCGEEDIDLCLKPYLFVCKLSVHFIPFKLEKLPTNNPPSTSLRHLLGLCLVNYCFSMILILFKCLTDGLRETCFLGPPKKKNKTCSPKHIVSYPLYLNSILFVGTMRYAKEMK